MVPGCQSQMSPTPATPTLTPLPELPIPEPFQVAFIEESSLPSRPYIDMKTIELGPCDFHPEQCMPIIDPGPSLEIRALRPLPPWPDPERPVIRIVVESLTAETIDYPPYEVYIQTLPQKKVYKLNLPGVHPNYPIFDGLPAQGVEELEFYFAYSHDTRHSCLN